VTNLSFINISAGIQKLLDFRLVQARYIKREEASIAIASFSEQRNLQQTAGFASTNKNPQNNGHYGRVGTYIKILKEEHSIPAVLTPRLSHVLLDEIWHKNQ
jgi:hypothetical protein